MTAILNIRPNAGGSSPRISGSSASASVTGQQTGRGTGAMSLNNFAEKNFDRKFAERFGYFLRRNFANPTQVAAAFGVRERTAENWWNGLNSPSGWQVAKVFLTWPTEARDALGATCGEDCKSSGSGSRASSSSGSEKTRQRTKQRTA